MRIDILTLFPGMFEGPLTESILRRARDEKILEIKIHDLRQWGLGKYHQVDDSPYGGGAGMILRCDVVIPAVEKISGSLATGQKPQRIYLSARGKRLKQTRVEQIARKNEWLILLCGHYEGIDQRIMDSGWIDEEISIGDYVLTGGELPAMVLIDAVARQIPGVLGKDESVQEESFSKLLGRKREYPHYTRPEEFRSLRVPDVLLGGHHAEIEKWRRKQVG